MDDIYLQPAHQLLENFFGNPIVKGAMLIAAILISFRLAQIITNVLDAIFFIISLPFRVLGLLLGIK